MKRYRERIHDLEARVASERETFAQAVEDYAAAARTRMRDRAVSPGSLLAVVGAGFIVGQVLKRRPPTIIKKTTETKNGFRWSGLLAGAAMSAARLASSNPGALVQIMQRIRSAKQAPGKGRASRGYPVEEHV